MTMIEDIYNAQFNSTFPTCINEKNIFKLDTKFRQLVNYWTFINCDKKPIYIYIYTHTNYLAYIFVWTGWYSYLWLPFVPLIVSS